MWGVPPHSFSFPLSLVSEIAVHVLRRWRGGGGGWRQATVTALAQRVAAARRTFPGLRWRWTVATLGAPQGENLPRARQGGAAEAAVGR